MKPPSHFASLLSNKFIINSRGNELEEFVRMVQLDARDGLQDLCDKLYEENSTLKGNIK